MLGVLGGLCRKEWRSEEFEGLTVPFTFVGLRHDEGYGCCREVLELIEKGTVREARMGFFVNGFRCSTSDGRVQNLVEQTRVRNCGTRVSCQITQEDPRCEFEVSFVGVRGRKSGCAMSWFVTTSSSRPVGAAAAAADEQAGGASRHHQFPTKSLSLPFSRASQRLTYEFFIHTKAAHHAFRDQ